MTGYKTGSTFFTDDERQAIEAAIPAHPLFRHIWIHKEIADAAAYYLGGLEHSQRLPDKARLRQRREKQLEHVEAVIGLLGDPDDFSSYLDNMRLREPAIDFMEALVANCERMSSVDFEYAIARRLLGRIADDLKRESFEEQMKADHSRDYRHRNTLIEALVRIWASANAMHPSQCTISAVEGSPLLTFIQSVCDPIWKVTNEAIGARMIADIVRKFVQESVSNERL